MTYEQALDMLHHFPKKPGDDWDRHCIGVGNIACRLARELAIHIPINPDEVRLFGLVHDFGRSVSQCPYGHIYEGYRLFRALNEPVLARICLCHSNGTFREEDLAVLGLNRSDFMVKTQEEKLVFMADNLDCHGRIIRQCDRLHETIARYQKTDPSMVPILYSKFAEFEGFDAEIRNITGKTAYEILGI